MTTGPSPASPDPRGRAEHEYLGSLMSQVSADLSTLIRQEMALAKAEMTASARQAGKGAGLVGGAGVAGHFVLLFLSIALWSGIGGTAVGYAWSAAIVAVVWAIAAAILAVLGKKTIDDVQGAPRTVQTVKDIPDAVTPSEETR